jgi:hypothetical protein
VNRLLKPAIFVLAAVYFVVDVVFLTIAKPVGDWLAEQRVFDGLREWIVSLRPYPSLALFALPFIVLEPIKPVAAYLATTGHVMVALTFFAAGEILKLVFLERLFAVSRNKLMSIPAFAWAYGQYRRIMDRLESTEVCQAVRRRTKIAQYAVRGYAVQLKASQKLSLSAALTQQR